ncbi:uncharacterized protein MCYG_07724 [Microsporum canis CBS 113480]|uniref:Uncharacterized protein n=1 Tax=Arthroderma otae (strain ATCC MYA-4605 / CBS 113480) TaxID=554155 RepID=C5FX65_ARTOC|nr:uncharacterized protein MCYG_07724 [Microsporum canis CBS 113480]EEQ34905.1 predicted protein [Microsporum canis CBS 113480]
MAERRAGGREATVGKREEESKAWRLTHERDASTEMGIREKGTHLACVHGTGERGLGGHGRDERFRTGRQLPRHTGSNRFVTLLILPNVCFSATPSSVLVLPLY